MKMEYLFIKKKDKKCGSITKFKNMLSTNEDISISNDKIVFKDTELQCKIVQYNVAKNYNEIAFYMSVESPNEQADILHELERVIRPDLAAYGFAIRLLLDEVSREYTKKLYPKISNVETTARKLINLIMAKVGGRDWANNFLPEKIRSRLEQEALEDKDSQDETNETNSPDNGDIFLSLNFIDLHTFLFTNYVLKSDTSELIDYLKKDSLTKKEQERLINLYENKTNWERFFKESINSNSLEKNLPKLNRFRNIVAHNKRITKKEYDNALKIIKVINADFDELDKKINSLILNKEEAEAIKDKTPGLLGVSDSIKQAVEQASAAPSELVADSCSIPISSIHDLKNIYGGSSYSLTDSLKTLKDLCSCQSDVWKSLGNLNSLSTIKTESIYGNVVSPSSLGVAIPSNNADSDYISLLNKWLHPGDDED